MHIFTILCTKVFVEQPLTLPWSDNELRKEFCVKTKLLALHWADIE